MTFLLDANIPYSANEIFGRGHTVYHVRDIHLSCGTDDEIMRWVSENRAVVVTRDLDFANTMHFNPRDYYGIVVLRLPYFYSAESIKRVLKSCIERIVAESLEGVVVVVEEGRLRMRKFV